MKVADILIENYQTKDGREIVLKRFEDTEPENRGFIVDEVKAFVDGEEAGYLKIQNVPRENIKKFFPTIYNYISQIRGSKYLPFGKEHIHYKDLTDDERRVMLKDVVYVTFVPWGEEKKYVNSLSNDEVLEKLEYFEDKLNKGKEGKDFKEFVKYHVDKPFVDFIRVYEPFRRQRIAEAMYLEGAKWMKERGMRLHASGLQQPAAAAAWDHLAKNYTVKKTRDNRRYLVPPEAA